MWQRVRFKNAAVAQRAAAYGISEDVLEAYWNSPERRGAGAQHPRGYKILRISELYLEYLEVEGVIEIRWVEVLK